MERAKERRSEGERERGCRRAKVSGDGSLLCRKGVMAKTV